MKFLSIIILFLFFTTQNILSQSSIENQYIIQFSSQNNVDNFNREMSNHGIKIEHLNLIFSDLNIYSLSLEGSKHFDKNYFLTLPYIKYLQNDVKLSLRKDPNDNMFADQWYLDRINAPNAWDISTGGTNYKGDDIVIAVVDDGFDIEHVDLIANLWQNVQEIDNDGLDNDNNGYVDDIYGLNVFNKSDEHAVKTHGTKVCGIIGATGNNGQGTAGINWNIKMMLISGQSTESSVIEAYGYALEQRKRYNQSNGTEGAYVVAANSSFGVDNRFGDEFPLWCEVYNSLGQEGILSVIATTNNSVDIDVVGDMPTTCSSEFIISVTSLNRSNEITGGAGPINVDIAAPGIDLLSTTPGDNYGNINGTSGACPQVSAGVALMYSLNNSIFDEAHHQDPAALALSVKNAILDNSKKLSNLKDTLTSDGMLDLFFTMESLATNPTGDEVFKIRKLSPNPVRDILSISYVYRLNADHQVFIHDVSGKLISSRSIVVDNSTNRVEDFNIKDFSPGVYIITIGNDDSILSQIFVKIN